MRDAYLNPPDYDESICRATACEVLARRIIHNLPPDRLESVMSTRFRYRESDGDESAPTSALESAIDQHCTVRGSSFSPPTRSKGKWYRAEQIRSSCHPPKRNTWSTRSGAETGSSATTRMTISTMCSTTRARRIAFGNI